MSKVSTNLIINDLYKEVEQFHSHKEEDIEDTIVSTLYHHAKQIHDGCVTYSNENRIHLDKLLDDIITSKWFGYPFMLLLLGCVFWLTIIGANYPSQLLSNFLFGIEGYLSSFFEFIGSPAWLHGLLVSGLYRSVAWVVSVMLPPMAIFFPLFTILEDLGYLPRIAFNLDRFFKSAGAHGKQALTMSMGFGCNAAAIVSCRIIESPRERLIAILTNNFVPCNGRFPTLIAMSTILAGLVVGSSKGGGFASIIVISAVLLGVGITWIVSFMLSKTFLKGEASTFMLELPPYRTPQFGRIFIRSIFDRTLYVLVRAICTAGPAGIITWILANTYIENQTLLSLFASTLQPFAQTIGLDGFILAAFILGLPANEIVLPILIMGYLSKGMMMDLDSIDQLKNLLLQNGWSSLTIINTMIFSVLHFPCGTTIWTIAKETKSVKWTVLAVLLPTCIAILICFLTTQLSHLF